MARVTPCRLRLVALPIRSAIGAPPEAALAEIRTFTWRNTGTWRTPATKLGAPLHIHRTVAAARSIFTLTGSTGAGRGQQLTVHRLQAVSLAFSSGEDSYYRSSKCWIG